MARSFADLGAPEAIVAVLDRAGIRKPFPVQAATIPDLFAGRDVIGRAPTGSGKTLAFGIPMVSMVKRAEARRPAALVLAPTRELAAQIATDLEPIASVIERRVFAVYGGVLIEPQIKKLGRGVDVLVATPGRLEDLIARGAASLDDASIVVVDEADRMADMGFMPIVTRLLDQTSSSRQTVLYSATLDGDVAKLIDRYQNDPALHEIGPGTPDLKKMEHYFWELPRSNRVPLCASAIATFGRTIVFTRTRHGADRLTRQLQQQGVEAVAIHGNRSQAQRKKALADLISGKAQALVATDVAARGIHVDGVKCVVHYDPVDEDSAYIHRSGRTARAGARGRVVSFVDPGQVRLVRAMIRRLELPHEITPPPETEGTTPDPPPRDDQSAPPPRPEQQRRSEQTRRPQHGEKRPQSKPKPKQKQRKAKPKAQKRNKNKGRRNPPAKGRR